jgi:hypothetical protein
MACTIRAAEQLYSAGLSLHHIDMDASVQKAAGKYNAPMRPTLVPSVPRNNFSGQKKMTKH